MLRKYFPCYITVLEPFNSSLSNGHSEGEGAAAGGDVASGNGVPNKSPIFEEWFHGNLSRKDVSRDKNAVYLMKFKEFPRVVNFLTQHRFFRAKKNVHVCTLQAYIHDIYK